MNTASVATYVIKAAGVFAPELKAMVPDIVAAVETVEKAEAIAAPYFAAGSPSLFSLLPMFLALEQMMPELIKAAQTFEKIQSIAAAYEAKIETAEATKPPVVHTS